MNKWESFRRTWLVLACGFAVVTLLRSQPKATAPKTTPLILEKDDGERRVVRGWRNDGSVSREKSIKSRDDVRNQFDKILYSPRNRFPWHKGILPRYVDGSLSLHWPRTNQPPPEIITPSQTLPTLETPLRLRQMSWALAEAKA